jgi:probable phosphoglycerate mutase
MTAGARPGLAPDWHERLIARARGWAFQPRAARFCFLRHGQTAHNHQRICQGQHDVPLNALGLAQAEAAALLLADQPIAGIHMSDLQRARATAAPIVARHGLAPVPDARLRERGFGVLENRPVVGPLWGSAEPSVEPIEAFVDRVIAGLDAALQRNDMLVVAHGGIRIVLAQALGLALADWTAHNALPLWVERRDGAWRAEALTASGRWPAGGPAPPDLDR